MEVGELVGDPTDLAEDGQWPEGPAVDAFSKAGQVPPSQAARVATAPCVPLEMGKQCRFPGFPLINRGWAAGQQNLLLEGGLTFPFQSPRLRDQGTQESNTFQDLIS